MNHEMNAEMLRYWLTRTSRHIALVKKYEEMLYEVQNIKNLISARGVEIENLRKTIVEMNCKMRSMLDEIEHLSRFVLDQEFGGPDDES